MSGGTINIADLVATMRVVDEVTPVMRQVSQTSVSEIGKLQASVTSANAEVRGLAKSWQDFHETPRIQSGIEQELGAAVVKAQALSAQLAQTKKDIKDALTPPTPSPSLPDALNQASDKGTTFAGVLGKMAGAALAYASVTGVLTAIKSTTDWGLELERTSQQLGVTAEMVQVLNFATAVPMNTITAAITQLQRKLSLEDGGAVRALTDLGLSFDAIRAMDPEKQFETVAAALASVTDQSKFAGLAAELFNSRSGTSIAAVIKHYQDLKEQAHENNVVLSNEQVDSLAEVGRMWETTKLKSEAYFASVIVGIRDSIKEFRDQPSNGPGITGPQMEAAQVAAQVAALYKSALSAAPTLPSFAAPHAPNLGDDKQGIANMKELDVVAQRLTQSARESITLHKQQAEAAAKYNTALLDLSIAENGYAGILANVDGTVLEAIKFDLEHHAKLEDIVQVYGVLPQVVRGVQEELKFEASVTDATNKMFGDHVQIMGMVTGAYGNLHGQLTGLNTDGTVFAETLGQDLTFKVNNFGSSVDLASDHMSAMLKAMRSLKEEANPLGEALDATLNDLPKIIERSFEGGGGVDGVFKAAGADMGKHFAGSIKTSIGDVLPESMNNAIGGAVGSVLGGVGGALISEGLNKLMSLIKNIGGPSAAEVAGRKTEGDFEKSFGGFDQMMAAVGSAFDTVGKSSQDAQAAVAGLLAAEKQGPAAVQAWIDKINATMTEAKQKIQDVATATNGIVDAAKNVDGALTPVLRDQIQHLLTMKGLTDDEKTALNGLLGDNATDFKALTSLASDYGVSLQQLGPKFQQANITDTARDIYNVFTELTAAGGDVDGVLEGMAPKFSKLVDDAMAFGVSVPEALRPTLQKLVDMGDLTDANGLKLTDLSGIKFADTPIDTGMDKLTKAIEHLSNVLQGIPDDAKKAADGIQDHLGKITIPPIDVHYRLDGGDGAPLPMAGGGDFMVSKPTLFLAGEAGPERASFSGANRTSMPGASDHLDEMRAMHATIKAKLAFVDNLPDDMARAVMVAMQQHA
jgi:hypothetical protein